MKLQREKRQDEAFESFETAARLAPRDVEYVTAREMTRQQLVFDHLTRGNAEMRDGRQIEALAEFRSALHLDPQNEFAQQRLTDALGEWTPKKCCRAAGGGRGGRASGGAERGQG